MSDKNRLATDSLLTRAIRVSFSFFLLYCSILGRVVTPASAQEGSGNLLTARQLTDYYLYDVTWGNASLLR